jgi:hypothetical protein
VWVPESIHDAASQVPGFMLVRDVRLLIEDEEQVHEITAE